MELCSAPGSHVVSIMLNNSYVQDPPLAKMKTCFLTDLTFQTLQNRTIGLSFIAQHVVAVRLISGKYIDEEGMELEIPGFVSGFVALFWQPVRIWQSE